MGEELDHEIEAAEVEPLGYEDESKADKFKRLANFRLRVAAKRIRMFKPLASANYDYNEDQVRFIIAALRNEIDDVERAFTSTLEDDDVPQL